MPQLSGHKRLLPKGAKSTKRPNKKFKKDDSRYSKEGRMKMNEEEQKFRAKHPFKSFNNNNNSKSIIKLDKSSNNNSKYMKPNGPLSKKDLRQRKRDRKSKRSHGKLRTELNYLASSHNDTKLSKRSRKDQHEFVGKLLSKIKGNILNIANKLDSTRAIQTAIKYGSQPQILLITKELKGHFIDLCCDHYAHKTVRSLLEYGRDEVRNIIISELMKAITRLILHRLASAVIDYAVMVIADQSIKRKAFQYFISQKFIIFTQYEDTENDKDNDNDKMPKTINDILIHSNMMERNQIIRNMEKFLISGFEKEIISTGIFQTILYHYIHHIFGDKKKMEEIIDLIVPSIMEIQNVKEGVMAIIDIINYSVWLKPKLRKTLIKNMSDHIITMCCDKYSYLIIIRLLDIIDDTVLLNKIIIKKIYNHLHILMYHDFGRLILLHLLTPRNKKYFGRNKLYQMLCNKPITIQQFQSNQENSFLEDDDDDDDDDNDDIDISMNNNNNNNNYVDPSKQANCKKDYDLKRIEILKKLLPEMIDYSCKNIKKLLCHDIAGSVVIELLRILFYDDNVKNMRLNKDGLIKSIIDSSIIDITPREMSPTPSPPEAPQIDDDVEINNVVDDSLKIIDKKQQQQQGQGVSLSNVDITKMSPMTARNIEKLKQHEIMKKNNAIYMKLNSEYEVKMINYNLLQIRHKKKIKTEDEKYGIIEHGLGHRRLRKMVEEFMEIHQYLMHVLEDKDIINEDKWIKLLSVKGVYVIWELYNCGNQQIKNKLNEILKPICLKMKDIINEQQNNGKNKNEGLKKLCNALNVDL